MYVKYFLSHAYAIEHICRDRFITSFERFTANEDVINRSLQTFVFSFSYIASTKVAFISTFRYASYKESYVWSIYCGCS